MPPSLGTIRHLHSSYFTTSSKSFGSPGHTVLERSRAGCARASPSQGKPLGKEQGPQAGRAAPGWGAEQIVWQGQPRRGGGCRQAAPGTAPVADCGHRLWPPHAWGWTLRDTAWAPHGTGTVIP